MAQLFDAILKYIPAPQGDPDAPAQVLISTIDYNEYVGRIGIGKVERGTIKTGQEIVVCNYLDADMRKKCVLIPSPPSTVSSASPHKA